MAHPTRASAQKTHFAERLQNIHILIVISSARAALLVKRLFENLGFTSLYLARDAAEAVGFLRDVQLHLIVTDSDLKVGRPSGLESSQAETETLELSGVQFVHRLRRAPASPAPFIPVLMLMDHANSDEIMKARDAGVNEVALKPLEAENFCERIVALIDHPRIFITADTYKGPCRRHKPGSPPGAKERRVREIRLIRNNDPRGRRS